MTNKEAMKIVKSSMLMHSYRYSAEELEEAFNIAIKALGVCDKIKAIIEGWAVDDEEYELLNQIANIIGEEAENETDN